MTFSIRQIALVAAVALSTGCGKDPAPATGPTPTPAPSAPQITGTWNGRITMSAGSGDVRFELQQSDRAVTGTWRILNASLETVGTVDGTIAGNGSTATMGARITWDASSDQGATRCTGFSLAEGPAAASAITLRAATIQGSNCEGLPRDIAWILTR